MPLSKKVMGDGKMCKSEARLDGKVVIVTGSTAGIGLETARDLATRGAKVIMACRNLEKAKPILADIKTTSGNENVYVLKLDLCSLKSVVEFVNEFKSKESQLHVLINNAGIYLQPRKMTDDGFEQVWQANYLGHFLLTLLLLDLLKQSAPSRIVNVASYLHTSAKKIHFDDIHGEKKYVHMEIYGQSKLAQILNTRKLAKIIHGSGVSVFALHPGFVNAEGYSGDLPFFSRGKWQKLIFETVGKVRGLNVVQGAQTTIHCAVAEGLEEESGEYFVNCEKADTSSTAKDDDLADKLWDFSNDQVKQYL